MKLTQTAEWKKDLENNAFENAYLNSAATRNYLKAEYDRFRSALAEVGLARWQKIPDNRDNNKLLPLLYRRGRDW